MQGGIGSTWGHNFCTGAQNEKERKKQKRKIEKWPLY